MLLAEQLQMAHQPWSQLPCRTPLTPRSHHNDAPTHPLEGKVEGLSDGQRWDVLGQGFHQRRLGSARWTEDQSEATRFDDAANVVDERHGDLGPAGIRSKTTEGSKAHLSSGRDKQSTHNHVLQCRQPLAIGQLGP